MTIDEKLESLGLALPALVPPGGSYVRFQRIGDIIYLSGQPPRLPDGSKMVGKVGMDVSVEQAYEHARLAGLALLAVMKEAAGSLDRVRVLKLLAMVNCAPDFADHPKVINGCSDLLNEILGENGKHARSAVGMGSLPGNITVEIEAVIAVTD